MNVNNDLLKAAVNAAATLEAVYAWVDMVDEAGGATSIQGVAKCHAMLESLRKNRTRANDLVINPLRKIIKDTGK